MSSVFKGRPCLKGGNVKMNKENLIQNGVGRILAHVPPLETYFSYPSRKRIFSWPVNNLVNEKAAVTPNFWSFPVNFFRATPLNLVLSSIKGCYPPLFYGLAYGWPQFACTKLKFLCCS